LTLTTHYIILIYIALMVGEPIQKVKSHFVILTFATNTPGRNNYNPFQYNSTFIFITLTQLFCCRWETWTGY